MFRKPTRSLSAYNFFFKHERERLLQENGGNLKKVGFANVARIIGSNWKLVNEAGREQYKKMAAHDKNRYAQEMATWYEAQERFIATLEDEPKTTQEHCAEKSSDETDPIPHTPRFGQLSPSLQEDGSRTSEPHSLSGYRNEMVGERTSVPIVECFGWNDLVPDSWKDVSTSNEHLLISKKSYEEKNQCHQMFLPPPLPQSTRTTGVFDEKKSFAKMANVFGNDGIDLLLRAVGKP